LKTREAGAGVTLKKKKLYSRVINPERCRFNKKKRGERKREIEWGEKKG